MNAYMKKIKLCFLLALFVGCGSKDSSDPSVFNYDNISQCTDQTVNPDKCVNILVEHRQRKLWAFKTSTDEDGNELLCKHYVPRPDYDSVCVTIQTNSKFCKMTVRKHDWVCIAD